MFGALIPALLVHDGDLVYLRRSRFTGVLGECIVMCLRELEEEHSDLQLKFHRNEPERRLQIASKFSEIDLIFATTLKLL